jgi:hypothetical protein
MEQSRSIVTPTSRATQLSTPPAIPRRADAQAAVIACGALTLHLRRIVDDRDLAIDIYPLPPEMHNRPKHIAPEVEALLDRLSGEYERVIVAYADCGTRGELDAMLAQRGIARLRGNTCYDVFASSTVREALEAEPGTYLLTDFLVRSFERVVVRGLGLDRYPDLRDDYFRHYTRVLWLAQRPTADLALRAREIAKYLGLRLQISETGESGLAEQLERLLTSDNGHPESRSPTMPITVD